MVEEGAGGAGFGVVSEEDDACEGGIQGGHHDAGGRGFEVCAWVDLGGVDVVSAAVGVADVDFGCAGLEGGFDGEVDFGGHERAGFGVTGFITEDLVHVADADDAFHVDEEIDFHDSSWVGFCVEGAAMPKRRVFVRRSQVIGGRV